MIIGLKRGVVELADHDPEWEELAAQTIERLWCVFGSVAKDIQHVGSTAITSIKAKPIIDIAIGVQSFDSLEDVFLRLEADGFYKSVQHAVPNDILYALGDSGDTMRTHHIHIVEIDGLQWRNYINLRDYLNDCPKKASEYEKVKIEFAKKYPDDRSSYTKGKDAFFEMFLFEARMYAEMRQKYDVVNLDPIIKGWSEDKKYCVTTEDGTKYLLRITPIERYEVRKSLFEMLKQVDMLGIPMCKPVEFGTCDGGVYSLQSWIDGEDLETVLPLLSETEQYVLGLKSGEIIRKMHSIPAPETQEKWETRFNRKTDYKIQKYHECGLRFDGDEHVLAYIEQNRRLLKNRPQCFQHGDYHIGNMMLENDELKIIDFDRYDFGDPWEEFNRIVWSAAASPHFATGQLRGYFSGEPPLEFFKLLAFYIASNTLSSIYWAVPFGQSDLDTMMKQAQDVLDWFDNMKNPIPTWYKQNIELMDVYDADRKRIGYWIRGSGSRKENEHILIAAALLCRNDRRYLITKRSSQKDDANKWNIQGGAALAWEDSLAAAIRENGEECGIIPDASSAELFMSVMKNTVFFDIWLFNQECSLDEVTLCEGETCDVMAATLDEILELHARGEFTNGTVITADEFVTKLKAREGRV
jgi:aminoglycoside phosphotransferase (APT) family kinase protein/GrpB-like predicted nucleotidyltransferase (UPF0157 family)